MALSEIDSQQIIDNKKYIQTFGSTKGFDEYLYEYECDETGICFSDKDGNIKTMYKADSPEEAKNTAIKVMAICELTDEEITKVNKWKKIIKGIFEIAFRKKVTVMLLSLAFLFMCGVGIKEKIYVSLVMYGFGFFKVGQWGEYVHYVKALNQMYKVYDEAILDEELNKILDLNIENEEIDNFSLYLKRLN